eukprot:GILK01012226.1.p1 GENE.GILK01012226.1~~GILK01012226.1.p1  ORF type:complete len:869 (-),score=115.44 GILK01012226.1:273-2879(-)
MPCICAGSVSVDGFVLPGAETHYAPDMRIEPKHIKIELALDILNHSAHAKITHTVAGHGGQTLKLDGIAFKDVRVTALDGHEISYSYDDNQILIVWASVVHEEEQRQVQVQYDVVNPIQGLIFSVPDEQYPNRPFYVFTDHETERARYWLACVDYPAVRTSLEFFLTYPKGLVCLANGLLQDEAAVDGESICSHWLLSFPCPSYLCCFGVGNFSAYQDTSVDGMEVKYFADASFSADCLQRSFQSTPGMLRWLSNKVGAKFPFPKYFQLATTGIRGAMENISLVTWGQQWLLDEQLEKEWRVLFDQINIHEMAHSYFGDALVCRHFEHSWLKESWATYMEYVWMEEHVGTDMSQFDLLECAHAYMQEADTKYARPIVTRRYDSSWNLFDRHLYPGGAWRIHMLRRLLGEDCFWQGVRVYVAENQAKLVETEDFRRALERESALNLNRFFDQWIYGRGYPKLRGQFLYDLETRTVTICLEQVQDSNWSRFEFDLEVELTDDLGKVHHVTLRFALGGNGVPVQAATTVKLHGNPRMIRFDPESNVLFNLELSVGEDILVTTASTAGDIRNRIWAFTELIRDGSSSCLRRVQDLILCEPFFGVRVKVAQVLGSSNLVAAADILSAMVRHEQHPMALERVVFAAAVCQHSKVREAVLTRLQEGHSLPYRAHAALLFALASQNQIEDVPFVMECIRDPRTQKSWHAMLLAGSLTALAEYHLSAFRHASTIGDIFALLRDSTSYGRVPEYARPAAVKAFARFGSRLDSCALVSEAVAVVVDLLRDADYFVRKAAVEGLVSLRAANQVAAVSAVRLSLARQDVPWLERQLVGLRGGERAESGVVECLKKDVDTMIHQCKRMEQQLHQQASTDMQS